MLVAFVLQAPQIEPEALALVETMQRAYQNVRSLSCTLMRFPLPDETTRVVYRRPDGLLIQRRSTKGPVRVECRVQDGKALVSSPGNPRYLRAPLGADERPFGALMNRVPRAGVPFGPMLDGEPFIRPNDPAMLWPPSGRLVGLSLGPRAEAADGTPVDTLIVDRSFVNPRMHVLRPFMRRSFVQIGSADHLIRRVTYLSGLNEGGFGGGGRSDEIEVRDLVVDAPAGDAELTFRPEKGAVAVPPPRHDGGNWSIPAASYPSQSALLALRSLLFEDETTVTRTTGGKTNRHRTTLRVELQRLLRARAQIVSTDPARNDLVISDGTYFLAPTGHGPLPSSNPNYMGDPAYEIANLVTRNGRPEAPEAARQTIWKFFGTNNAMGDALFVGFRAAPGGVVERVNEIEDEFGIPTGMAEYERYWIDPKDHLIRRYERQTAIWGEPDSRTDVPKGWLRVVERFTKVVPNAKIDPKRFVVPPS